MIKRMQFSNAHIERMAEVFSRRYLDAMGEQVFLRHGLTFDRVYEEFIYPEYEIQLIEDQDLGCDEAGHKILGRYDPLKNTAFVDRVLAGPVRDPRRDFTCWHEVVGHGVLQGDWVRQQVPQFSSGRTVVTTSSSLEFGEDMDALERQANVFAARAAVPDWFLNHAIRVTFAPNKRFRYFAPCTYWLEVRGHHRSYRISSFLELCRVMAHNLKHMFGGLSTEALSYRIEHSDWLENFSAVPCLSLYRIAKRSPFPRRVRHVAPRSLLRASAAGAAP